jgi:LAGLIDADG DNA endonuclease family
MKNINFDNNFQLSETEKSILFGTLLGDAHLQKRGNSYRVKIQHEFKQKDYVIWKHQQLNRLVDLNAIKHGSLHSHEHFYFFFKSGNYLKEFHDLMYKPYLWQNKENKNLGLLDQQNLNKKQKEKIRYKKTITYELIQTLPKNPLVLAVWYMDDGHLRSNAFSGKLGTCGFSKDEHFLLQEYLGYFNIQSNIVLNSRLKNQYYLSLTAKNNNFNHFINLIQTYVLEVPSMHYKIKNP